MKHESNAWNAQLYSDKHAFVWQLGAGVIELLNPQPRENILDLGCGTGELTAQIAGSGAHVVGFDASSATLDKAKHAFPAIEFRLGDGQDFDFGTDFDAVFTNATLHWIANHAAVALSVHRALKSGGRFVGEFGGRGNVARLHGSLAQAAHELNLPPFVSPNTFPSLAHFARDLELGGLEPVFLQLFERPTPLEGEDGLRNWWRQFCASYLNSLEENAREAVLNRAHELAAPFLRNESGFFADYVRPRFTARRP